VNNLTNDGSILIAEVADAITDENNTQTYFLSIYNRIEASFVEFLLDKNIFFIG
jgi:hypothetical protein